jgi:DNA-binding NtrC family response regulator
MDKILLVEDELEIREVIKQYLQANGYDLLEADGCAQAEQVWRAGRPDVAVLDYSLRDGNALDLIPRLKAIDPLVPIIILTGHASIDLAVEAVKLGAEQFLTKPTELATLLVVIERSLENQRNRQKGLAEKSRLQREAVNPFLGSSAAIQQLAETAHKVLSTDRPVLIQGETGTGKGVLAKWLHLQGPRGAEPFVDLNCGGLTRDLLETELFGHERGAFTGAVQSKTGLLELAHKGTVFLDEIGDVDLQVQPKLLKVLEEKQFRRLGDVRDRKVDIRLIAATHQDIPKLVWEKRFRDDLYFRISTIPLTTPPLRQRVEDIPILAGFMLDALGADLGMSAVKLTASALSALQAYSWPGNIRELRNVLERAVLLSGSRVLGERDLHFDALPEAALPAMGGVRTLEEVERQHIQEVLFLERGRVEAAAKRLGIPRSSLYNKIKQYGIARQASSDATMH